MGAPEVVLPGPEQPAGQFHVVEVVVQFYQILVGRRLLDEAFRVVQESVEGFDEDVLANRESVI